MMDGLISNEAFINNADSNSRSSSSSSNDPLGVLLEAPLGAYRRLKMKNRKRIDIYFKESNFFKLNLNSSCSKLSFEVP